MPEPLVAEAISEHLLEGDVAVDVGANPKGADHVDTMAEVVGETGLVIAFDPFPIPALLAKGARHMNIVVVPEAVTNRTVEIEETEENVGQDAPGDRTYEGGIPLDTVAYADLVKVDVEGFELDVIESGRNLIRRCQPTFIIEIHPEKDRLVKGNERMVKRLIAADYDITSIQRNDPIPDAKAYEPRREHLLAVGI